MSGAAWSTWPAPAKLNLFLHIVGRREDGYHLLQTAFQLLDWGDSVHLRERADTAICRNADLPGVAAQDDLCVLAAQLLQAESGVRRGIDVRVDKRIPLGGGLGGGSSDAATVLVALNEVWETRLDVDQLAGLGVKLGADVPVFVRGFSAWAEGIGDQLKPLTLPERHFVIVDPRVRVATADLFQAAELTRNTAPTTISGYLSGSRTHNDFTAVVRDRFPQIATALEWLGQFGDACLSGSGSCIFIAVDSREAASTIVQSCPQAFSACEARGINFSPLHAAVAVYRRGVAESR